MCMCTILSCSSTMGCLYSEPTEKAQGQINYAISLARVTPQTRLRTTGSDLMPLTMNSTVADSNHILLLAYTYLTGVAICFCSQLQQTVWRLILGKDSKANRQLCCLWLYLTQPSCMRSRFLHFEVPRNLGYILILRTLQCRDHQNWEVTDVKWIRSKVINSRKHARLVLAN